jgi:hypothetical protein
LIVLNHGLRLSTLKRKVDLLCIGRTEAVRLRCHLRGHPEKRAEQEEKQAMKIYLFGRRRKLRGRTKEKRGENLKFAFRLRERESELY